MDLVFTRMPGESYCRPLRSLLLCLCDVFRALIISLPPVLILHDRFGPRSVSDRKNECQFPNHCKIIIVMVCFTIFSYNYEHSLSTSFQGEP